MEIEAALRVARRVGMGRRGLGHRRGSHGKGQPPKHTHGTPYSQSHWPLAVYSKFPPVTMLGRGVPCGRDGAITLPTVAPPVTSAPSRPMAFPGAFKGPAAAHLAGPRQSQDNPITGACS